MIMTRLVLGLLVSTSACSKSGTADDGQMSDGDARVSDAPPAAKGVSTIAGAATTGDVDGDGGVARFSNPVNVLLANDGTVYVADFDNGKIRAIDGFGVVSTLVSQTGFSRPFGLALSAGGTLYVGTDNGPDGGHSATSGTVWRVDMAARAATVICTGLGRPRGLAALADGRIAMADEQRHVIQLLDPATGTVVMLAGALDTAGYLDAVGGAARFARPYGIALRPDGTLVVADYGNQRLRLVDTGTGATTTLAGSGVPGFVDGALANAEFNMPEGVAIDGDGNIYVTDTGNYRVRRVHGDAVDTVAGDGTGGFVDASDPIAAELYGLEGLAAAHDGGALVVADGNRGEDVPYNRVRLVNMTR